MICLANSTAESELLNGNRIDGLAGEINAEVLLLIDLFLEADESR